VKLLSAIAHGTWLASSLPAWGRFRRALREPEQAQQQILRRILEANSESEYGRAHGFHGIRDYAQFRERVPIVDYEYLQPWIERIRGGGQCVLTREPVNRLVPTGGSTAGRKLIPYTAAFQAELNAAIGPWIVDLCRTIPSIAGGPAYWSISPAIPSTNEVSAVPIGFDDDSAYLGGLRQRLAETTFAVPSALRQVTDIESSRYLTLLSLLREPELRFISVWHPSFLALLLDALPAWWDELLDDLENGGCRRTSGMANEIKVAFAAGPQPRRATELRMADPREPRAVWPHLAAVSCWGDAQAALPLADLQRRLRTVNFQAKGLLATEAFVSIPFMRRHPIAIASHFFEFEDSRGEVRLASGLSAGGTYSVIVTTAGGLYRYRLGDLVEVDGSVGATPSLRFLGRGGSMSDLCGEKLTEAFVTRAIETACASCGFVPRFAMLAPSAESTRSRSYTLFVEGNLPTDLAERVDNELRENPHYALCRDLGQLGALNCFHVAGGAYQTYCQVLAASGSRIGDIKPQALSAREDWNTHFMAAASSESMAPFPVSF
jgi:hypothetical protein